MSEYYEMKIAGLTRKLPICPIDDTLDIAGFIMFSDVEVTVEASKELLKKVPDFDVILTAESKGIPLAYEMAKQSGKQYVVARKSVKLYMVNPISITVKSITTSDQQTLYISEADVENLKGKRILITDDVISTGGSLLALEKLAEKAEGTVCAKAAVLAEGDASKRDDIIFLEELPLFFK